MTAVSRRGAILRTVKYRAMHTESPPDGRYAHRLAVHVFQVYMLAMHI